VGLVETSKEPSKGNCSNSSAKPFDVVPVISRIGGGREESGCWRNERFIPASLVAARTVYRGGSVFDNEVAPVKEQPVGVEWVGVSFSDVQTFSKKIFAVIGEFDVVRLKDELAINVP